MIRRILLSLLATIALLLGGASIAEAAPLKPLYLAKATISTGVTEYPVPVCDYNSFSCGYVSVAATFAGLNRAPWRPTGPEYPEALLNGTVQVSRDYGCADSSGKRLRQYDRTVNETAQLGVRRGAPVPFPREGDTVTITTWAFLSDSQPGNCPAGTTPTMYKLVAKHAKLELVSLVTDTTGTYCASGRSQWVGAAPTPARATVTP
ncbi:hypothetical protein [Nakamurella sp.]|uniref:hypothetical protein n=1 Tax=Nakamurella sp. TaxID=1869182 RepID=UPI003B3BDA22